MGLTTGGTIGATVAMALDEAIDTTMRIVLVICHGGPFDEPEVVGEALARMPGIHGFYGATSMERLPVERGITEQVRKFTEIKTAPLKKKSHPGSE